jgi:hypothetical protein
MANVRSRTTEIDVLTFLNFAAILNKTHNRFRNPAELTGYALYLIGYVLHQYIGAANHSFKNKENP